MAPARARKPPLLTVVPVTSRRRGVDAFEDWAARLPEQYLACRTRGHAWEGYTAVWVSDESAYRVGLQCYRCQSKRTDWLDVTGALVGRGYDMAEGYYADRQTVGLTTSKEARARLRLHELTREGARR